MNGATVSTDDWQIVARRGTGMYPGDPELHVRRRLSVLTLCGRNCSDWPVQWDGEVVVSDGRVCSTCRNELGGSGR